MTNYNNCDLVYSLGEDSSAGCLWLGDYNSSKHKRTHKDKNIQTIITAGLGMKLAVATNVKHRLYPLYDSPGENIEKYYQGYDRFFEQAYDHIEMGLQEGNVLVHCYAGVSRSSTIVISYLMKKQGWSYRETVDYVRKKRWVINPNPGFVKQLRRYETKLKQGNNPEVEKLENNFFSTTLKNKKVEVPSKTYKSIYMTKSSLVRGASLFGPKTNNPRLLNYSMAKK